MKPIGQTIVNHSVFRQALSGAGGAEATAGFESSGPNGDSTFFESLRPVLQREGETHPDEAVDMLREAFVKLVVEEKDPGILTTVQDPLASLLQSELAERGMQLQEGVPAPAGGFEVQFDSRDILGWVGSVFSWWRRLRPHEWLAPPAQPETFGAEMRVAVLSDWGTNLYGAPECMNSIRADPRGFGLLLHLGDVYYSGTKNEVKARFLDPWPKLPGTVSRALNSNHEMYSGGFAYFDATLPEFGQSSSCCALQNDHWLLVGLDSGYHDFDLGMGQAEWLEGLVNRAGQRRVVLFSHHQLFSLSEKQGVRMQARINHLLATRRIFAWYWGHEHRCLLHDAHPAWGLFGRCIGHSGMPYFRDVSGESDQEKWHRRPANLEAPGGVLLDGPNPYVVGKERKYGPNGYMTLEFSGPHLTEHVHLPDGKVVLSVKLTEPGLRTMPVV